jgi:hypothetical protein
MRMRGSTSNVVRADALNANELFRLLKKLENETHLERRIDFISSYFVGRSYDGQPLIGGPTEKEVLKISLDGFDCVTYVETVLAAARSWSLGEFVNEVRKLRYIDGNVDWSQRNHYMTGWARQNQKRHVIKNVTRGPNTIPKNRILSTVAGLPAHRVRFRCFPKKKSTRVREKISTGDIITFVSTKPGLDVFHIGLLIKTDGTVFMRHATRAAGEVVEQDLTGFLANNRMTGFILLRPIEIR